MTAPLSRKLGLKPAARVLVLGAPDGFLAALEPMPEGVTFASSFRGTRPFELIVLFTRSRAELMARFERAAARLEPHGGLWIAWPKRASKVPTDMTEDVVREVGLPAGLVDNKVCAIDETWSGLRLVVRRENRPRWPRPSGA